MYQGWKTYKKNKVQMNGWHNVWLVEKKSHNCMPLNEESRSILETCSKRQWYFDSFKFGVKIIYSEINQQSLNLSKNIHKFRKRRMDGFFYVGKR